MAEIKHCPGVESLGRPAHDAPATIEVFNKSGAGLSTRCRTCGNLYGRAWAAAKKASETFSGKAGATVPRSVQGMLAGDRIGTTIAEGLADALAPQQLEHPDGSAVFTATAAQRAERETASGVRQPLTYHDDLAVRASRGQAPGYSGEAVGGVIYALPDGPTVGTPEGQAALEAVNAARAAERRRRNTEAKREQRARARAAQAELTDGPRA